MGTIVYIDSFDHYSTAGEKGWQLAANAGLTTGRNGIGLYAGGNWQAGTDGSAYRDLTAMSEGIFGMAVRSTRLSAENILWREGGTNHVYMEWDGSGHMVFKHGGGATLGTTSSIWTVNTDKYVEVHLKVHDTTGFLRVYVNGVQEINFSGDTRNGGTGVINRFMLAGGQVTFEGFHYILIDDLYIIANDDGTSIPLGDCKVECDLPTGNGNSSQLDGSDGNSTNNYQLVDESPPNGDTDYVESATVDEKDTYAFSDLASSTGVVHAVQISAMAKKTDAGARGLKSIARLSGTEVDSSAQSLGTSYLMMLDIRETKPGGGSWTIADVNNAEFGVKVAA